MKTRNVTLTALAVCLFVAASVWWHHNSSQAPVKYSVRVHVSPADQLDYVLTKANSSRFKYVLGKKAKTKAYLAQSVELRSVPKLGIIEARVGLETQDEAKVYAREYVEALQTYCGSKVKLSVESERIQ